MRVFELAQDYGVFVRVYADLDSARLAAAGSAPPAWFPALGAGTADTPSLLVGRETA